MDIKEAIAARKQLEQNLLKHIGQELRDFSASTGLTISDLKIRTSYAETMDGQRHFLLDEVNVLVRV